MKNQQNCETRPGAGAQSKISLQYNFQNRLNLNGSFQYFGVGSAINGGDLGFGYAFYRGHSIRADFDLACGYGVNQAGPTAFNRFEVRPTVWLEKLITANTYTRTGISEPVGFRGKNNTQPTFKIEVGFDDLSTAQP